MASEKNSQRWCIAPEVSRNESFDSGGLSAVNPSELCRVMGIIVFGKLVDLLLEW